MSGERRPDTRMRFDDLMVVAAAAIGSAPRLWLVAATLLLVVIGPWGLPAAIPLQVACALLAGALLRRLRERPPFSSAAFWALPVAALGAQAVLTAAGDGGSLGVPFAVLAGCLLAAVGIAREEAVRPPFDVMLLAAGVCSVFAWKENDATLDGDPTELAVGVLFSLGVAAIALRASAWDRDPAEGLPRRSDPGRATAWVWWGLVPAILVSVPTPVGWPFTLPIAATVLLALLTARVARHVAWGVDEERASAARRRLTDSAQRSPASAVVLIAALAWLPVDGHLALAESARLTLGSNVGWLFEGTDHLSVPLVAVAIAAHGPARRLRGLLTAFFLALLLPVARVLVDVALFFWEQSIPAEYVWEMLRPYALFGATIAVLLLVIARFVPAGPRSIGPVEPALLVVLLAIRPVLAELDPVSNTHLMPFQRAPGPSLETPWFAAVFVVLFLRLATTPVRGRVLSGFALAAAVIATLTELDTLHPATEGNWGALVGNAVEWQLAAAGICVARLLAHTPPSQLDPD